MSRNRQFFPGDDRNYATHFYRLADIRARDVNCLCLGLASLFYCLLLPPGL